MSFQFASNIRARDIKHFLPSMMGPVGRGYFCSIVFSGKSKKHSAILNYDSRENHSFSPSECHIRITDDHRAFIFFDILTILKCLIVLFPN